MFSLDVSGLDQISVKLAGSNALVRFGLERGLVQSAELIMTRSEPLVPVLTGALRASGRVESPQWSGDVCSVDMTYNTPYAFKVHEDLLMRHPRGGTAKYLERPAIESRAQVISIVSHSVQMVLV